jgi:hypothetical protein
MSDEIKLRYHDRNARIRAQAEAEFAFAAVLERQGIDCEKLMDDLHLSVHQLNVMAHYVYGVNDEDPPAILVGLWNAANDASLRKRELAVA